MYRYKSSLSEIWVENEESVPVQEKLCTGTGCTGTGKMVYRYKSPLYESGLQMENLYRYGKNYVPVQAVPVLEKWCTGTRVPSMNLHEN